MKKHCLIPCIVLTALQLLSGCGSSVKFEEYGNRIDVRMKGDLFTTYLHALDLNVLDGRQISLAVTPELFLVDVNGEVNAHVMRMVLGFAFDGDEGVAPRHHDPAG